jgi:hypothetical protein
MVSVTNELFKLSVVMLDVVKPCVIMVSAVALFLLFKNQIYRPDEITKLNQTCKRTLTQSISQGILIEGKAQYS